MGKIFYLLFILCLSLNAEISDLSFSESQINSGNKIFSEMAAAVGDVSQINNVQTIGKIQQWFAYGSVSFNVYVTAIFPDKIKIKFQDKEYIINSGKGWRRYPKGYFENMPEKLIRFLSINLNRNLINIIKFKTKYRIVYLGSQHFQGKNCDVVLLQNENFQMKTLIDKKSHLPVQMIYKNLETDEPEVFYRNIEKYADINGIKYPVHTVTFDQNGEKICEIKLESVEFNVPVNEEEF